MKLFSNKIKRGNAHAGDTVEDFKDRLTWMASNPGEWLYWSRSSWGAKDLIAPAFQRKTVSPSRRNFDHLVDSDLAPGLWIRYHGISDAKGGEARDQHV